jgi:hypothetical protein
LFIAVVILNAFIIRWNASPKSLISSLVLILISWSSSPMLTLPAMVVRFLRGSVKRLPNVNAITIDTTAIVVMPTADISTLKFA